MRFGSCIRYKSKSFPLGFVELLQLWLRTKWEFELLERLGGKKRKCFLWMQFCCWEWSPAMAEVGILMGPLQASRQDPKHCGAVLVLRGRQLSLSWACSVWENKTFTADISYLFLAEVFGWDCSWSRTKRPNHRLPQLKQLFTSIFFERFPEFMPGSWHQ